MSRKKIMLLSIVTIVIIGIIGLSLYKINLYKTYENTDPYVKVKTYTIDELYENYANGLSKHFFNPQNIYIIKPTFDFRGVNINNIEGLVNFIYVKELKELQFEGECSGDDNNIDLTQDNCKNYLITKYDGLTYLNIEEQKDKLEDFISKLDAILNSFGNYIGGYIYGGSEKNIEYLDKFLNQYVDLSSDEREIVHDSLLIYTHAKEVEIFNEYFDNTNEIEDWVEYGRLKGLDKLLTDIDMLLVKYSGDNQAQNIGKFDIEVLDDYIDIVENGTDFRMSINDISVPPLTLSEIKMDEDNQNQLNLYSLLLLEELANRYYYEATDKICTASYENRKCIKDDIDILLSKESSENQKDEATSSLTRWISYQEVDVNRKLGFTNDQSKTNNLNNNNEDNAGLYR
ncbi:hypothetical protein RZE82_06520 [Mollicutes bacterium LVI A0039]|nr:hypothetical protein RZE82_06520 [Mollicutes bacterium LVI A0039]